MRQQVYWYLVMSVSIAIGMTIVDRTWAQRLIDPAPADDEPELAPDLPLPERSLVVQQPVRDNSRAFFGVTFDPQVRNAAVARSVSAGSPADEAGVFAGDTILSLNGIKIATYDDVLQTIGRLKPGDVLDVEISRRVSVRARAVLDGAPLGAEHTTAYHPDSESLPAPAGYRNEATPARVPANRAPANINAPRSRSVYNAPQNRNPNVNRNGNSNRTNNSNDRNRNDGARGGFFRRGR